MGGHVCFLVFVLRLKEREKTKLGEEGGEKELEGIEGRENMIKIYCMKKILFFFLILKESPRYSSEYKVRCPKTWSINSSDFHCRVFHCRVANSALRNIQTDKE